MAPAPISPWRHSRKRRRSELAFIPTDDIVLELGRNYHKNHEDAHLHRNKSFTDMKSYSTQAHGPENRSEKIQDYSITQDPTQPAQTMRDHARPGQARPGAIHGNGSENQIPIVQQSKVSNHGLTSNIKQRTGDQSRGMLSRAGILTDFRMGGLGKGNTSDIVLIVRR